MLSITGLVLLLLLVSTSVVVGGGVFDVVVYGATPAGIAAAISSSDHGTKKVALLEPSLDLGGMSVAGGIGLRDISPSFVDTLGGIGLQWAQLNAIFYGVNYPVLQPDSYVGLGSYTSLLADYSDSIQVVFDTKVVPEGVKKVGTTILQISTNTSTGHIEAWQAKIFIDASYEGDLMRFSSISYTYGRESHSHYNESLAGIQPFNPHSNFDTKHPVTAVYPNGTALPFVTDEPLGKVGTADTKLQGYSYRLCITNNKTNQVPFSQPADYNEAQYILLDKYIAELVSAGTFPNGPPFSYLVDVLPYRDYPPKDKWDLCDSPVSAVTSDVINWNEGYPIASYAERAAIAKRHRDYLAGFLYFIGNAPSVPAGTKKSVAAWGLCKDQWPDNGHFPTQIYVREAARMQGDYIMTQDDVYISSKCWNNSIAIGAWVIDIHVVQRVHADSPPYQAINEGQVVQPESGQKPYEIPYSILLPKRSEATNLLVPVCHSASHVAYGSLRVEPTFVQLGQASGVAAAVALKEGITVLHDVPIADLQAELVAQGVKIHTENCK